MKAIHLRYITAVVSAVVLLTACLADELPEFHCGEALKISVIAKGFGSSDSRTVDMGYTTTFVSGDRIGITVIKDGTVILENNIPYEYNGSTWQPVNPANAVHRYPGNITYLVHFPFDAAMDGKRTAAEIFAAFTPQADQSTRAAYTASNLMTGTGVLSGTQLNVTLTHALSLVEVNLPMRASNATLRVDGGQEYRLYSINGTTTYRAIIKPAANITLSGTYTILGVTMAWQRSGVTLTVGEYTRINTVNSFYTGDIQINYTDGSSEVVVYDPFTENIPFTPSGRTIESIELLDANNTIHLIGRQASGQLNLRIHGSGELLFRAADSNGEIPIGSFAEFQMINTVTGALGRSYRQEADLDLMNKEWTPIGFANEYYFNPFSGKFDGGSFTIANLYINQPDGINIGLFGAIDEAEITHVHIISGSVTGEENVGGIVGYVFSGIVFAGSNAASIEGVNLVGGIVGSNHAGAIIASRNTGTVTGVIGIGGIAGSNGGIITACYNVGIVSGDEIIGGVIGINEPEGIITACYNMGMLVGTDYIGGVVGLNMGKAIASYWLAGTAVVGVHNFYDYEEEIDGIDIDVESFTIPPGFIPDYVTYPEWSIGDGSNGYWLNFTGNAGAPQLWWE